MAQYKAIGSYNDAALTVDDRKKMDSLKKQYSTYRAAGNRAAAEKAHSEAEKIRANYGYSGGGDGSEYYSVETDKYIAPTTQAANSQEEYINGLYDAQRTARLQQLRSAYDQNMLAYDNAASEIPKTYQAARNQNAASYEAERANFNEYAASSGLNNGAAGQVQLSRANQQQANLSAIGRAQADALAQVERQRAQTKVQYQNDISQAIAEGDLARAQALYNEAVRVDESIVSKTLNDAQLRYNYDYLNYNKDSADYNRQVDAENTEYNKLLAMAQTLGAYGDFSGYKALGYTDGQIANMRYVWQLQNGIY